MRIAAKDVVLCGCVKVDLVRVKGLSLCVARVILTTCAVRGGIQRRAKQRLCDSIDRICDDVIGEGCVPVKRIIKLVSDKTIGPRSPRSTCASKVGGWDSVVTDTA